jgi:hypothetical protein
MYANQSVLICRVLTSAPNAKQKKKTKTAQHERAKTYGGVSHRVLGKFAKSKSCDGKNLRSSK